MASPFFRGGVVQRVSTLLVITLDGATPVGRASASFRGRGPPSSGGGGPVLPGSRSPRGGGPTGPPIPRGRRSVATRGSGAVGGLGSVASVPAGRVCLRHGRLHGGSDHGSQSVVVHRHSLGRGGRALVDWETLPRVLRCGFFVPRGSDLPFGLPRPTTRVGAVRVLPVSLPFVVPRAATFTAFFLVSTSAAPRAAAFSVPLHSVLLPVGVTVSNCRSGIRLAKDQCGVFLRPTWPYLY
jgi:hypothetical protein